MNWWYLINTYVCAYWGLVTHILNTSRITNRTMSWLLRESQMQDSGDQRHRWCNSEGRPGVHWCKSQGSLWRWGSRFTGLWSLGRWPVMATATLCQRPLTKERRWKWWNTSGSMADGWSWWQFQFFLWLKWSKTHCHWMLRCWFRSDVGPTGSGSG